MGSHCQYSAGVCATGIGAVKGCYDKSVENHYFHVLSGCTYCLIKWHMGRNSYQRKPQHNCLSVYEKIYITSGKKCSIYSASERNSHPWNFSAFCHIKIPYCNVFFVVFYAEEQNRVEKSKKVWHTLVFCTFFL